MDISSQAIELGDDQGRLGLLGGSYGGCKLRPVRPLAALHFAELPNQFASVGGHVLLDPFALRIQPQAAPTLAIGGNPIIAYKLIDHGALRNRQTDVCMLQKAVRALQSCSITALQLVIMSH